MKVGVSLTLLPVLGTLSLLLGCLIQPWYEGLCLDLFYRVMSIPHYFPWDSYTSLRGNEKSKDLGGRRSGGGATGRSGGRGGLDGNVLYEKRRGEKENLPLKGLE